MATRFREDGRTQRGEWIAKMVAQEGEHVALVAPSPGLFRTRAHVGQIVVAGEVLGELEVLGVVKPVRVPEGAGGVVLTLVGVPERGARTARPAVSYGDTLVVLDPKGSGVVAAGAATRSAATATDAAGLVLRSPSSGRYYGRPAPGKPPFVSVGDVVTTGQTVALLEVMKTFHRVAYGGDGMPARAKVLAIVPAEESDLGAGDVILTLEPS